MIFLLILQYFAKHKDQQIFLYDLIFVIYIKQIGRAGYRYADDIFVGYLPKRYSELDPIKKIALHCQAGDRATIAQSFLESKGFEVENYSGGIADWKLNQKPLVK